jgi:hypothetical protein
MKEDANSEIVIPILFLHAATTLGKWLNVYRTFVGLAYVAVAIFSFLL